MSAASCTPVLALGVDTGGTYTDAAIVTWPDAQMVASAKALTTPADLSVGIGVAIRTALAEAPAQASEQIGVVGLSTTLATNAIVEGVGHPVCLILIGYDEQLMHRFDLERHLVTRDIIHIAGGHDGAGEEIARLDETALRVALQGRGGRAEAYAVSGYFSIRNNSHELRAREIVLEEVGARDVTCAGDLTAQLDSVRRATTAALNARLIPLLRGLVTTVRTSLDEVGVRAPLMVVKGDGSMIHADLAMARPVETILSGPAASVIGAWHLAGRKDAWVVDVGGTTTDIAVLREGLPCLDGDGARVGGWRTMVETLHVHTVGLGGDSHISVEQARTGTVIRTGPRRVIPLSLLAAEHPEVQTELRRQQQGHAEDFPAEFIVPLGGDRSGLSDVGQRLLQDIGAAPASMTSMAEASPYGRLALSGLRELERRRLVLRAAFTPTDALHVLGRYKPYDVLSAELAADILAARLGLRVEDFCKDVVDGVCRRIAVEVSAKALCDEGTPSGWEGTDGAVALLDRAFSDEPPASLAVQLQLQQPLVLVGAPAQAYGPGAAQRLHTEIIVPEHAAVANAVGAVAGGIVQHLRVQVRPTTQDGVFHVLLPDGVVAVRSLAAAIERAHTGATEWLKLVVRKAGAASVEVRHVRRDHTAPVRNQTGETLVETELMFTAVGKPTLIAPDA